MKNHLYLIIYSLLSCFSGNIRDDWLNEIMEPLKQQWGLIWRGPLLRRPSVSDSQLQGHFLRKSLWTVNAAGSLFCFRLTTVKYLFSPCESWIMKLISLCVECTQTSFTYPKIIFWSLDDLQKRLIKWLLLLYVIIYASYLCGRADFRVGLLTLIFWRHFAHQLYCKCWRWTWNYRSCSVHPQTLPSHSERI